MKKGLLLVLALFGLLIAGIYVLIPARLAVSTFVYVNANSTAVYRCLTDQEKWAAWWPGTVSAQPVADHKTKNFLYENVAYRIEQTSVDAIGVRISNQATQTKSILQTIRAGADSTIIQWTCELATGNNPFKKIAAYSEATRLKKNMNAVLKKMQSFLEQKENVYSIAISRTKLKDSTMVVTRRFGTSYPGMDTVYGLIKMLRQYAMQEGAQETNYPMLHIEDRKDGRFETMVALPVNKKLNDKGTIFFKRMLVPTMLSTDVYGGPEKLKKANAELLNYINDHHLFSPAISFESLVTDRLAEPDTAKWITKIYLPVMEFAAH